MFVIQRNCSLPIYRQIYEALKTDITAHPNREDPLPAIRTMAHDLGVSINTVSQAYQQLQAEGYIFSIPGSGYFQTFLENVPTPTASHPETLPLTAANEKTSNSSSIKYDFHYGSIDNRSFPWTKWKKCLRDAIYMEEHQETLIYPDKQGIPELRYSIASMLRQTRNMNCTPDQVVICGGLQDAFYIISCLLGPTQNVLGFEEPGYNTARNLFLSLGYRICPLTYSNKGISMADLNDSKCRLIYLTPAHQYPSGHILPIQNRYQLLNYFNQQGGYIIEDDYDSLFRYRISPVPPLFSLDQNNRVIYLGTFSKIFTPTIRTAFAVFPPQLMERYHEVCRGYKTPVAAMIQYALHLFISQQYYAYYLQKVVRENEKKFQTIARFFREHESEIVQPILSEAGVHMLLEFNLNTSESELLKYLEEYGIRLYPANKYWYTKRKHPLFLQMGFASSSIEELESGLELLMHALTQYPNNSGSSERSL